MIIVITVVLLEIVLRVVAHVFPILDVRSRSLPDESLFWMHSSELGWDLVPDSTGVFTNGLFRGNVSIDRNGVRRNSWNGTYIDDFANILFVGDSTTASFEVDDHETVPAVLEGILRSNGLKFNVLNLGARGYGTDQSILKAKKYASHYNPTHIIYMYTNNDIFENNTLQRVGRPFGKGSFIRRRAGENFEVLDYPVPERSGYYAGIITLDKSCTPVVYEERSSRPKIPIDAQKREKETSTEDMTRIKRLRLFLREHSYVASALYRVRNAPAGQVGKKREADLTPADPYDYLLVQKHKLSDVSWDEYFAKIEEAYVDHSPLRMRCSEYFDSQLAFLLEQFPRKDRRPQLHVIQFPSDEAVAKGSSVSPLFNEFAQQGVVETHLDLSRIASDRNISVKKFRCAGDFHFCEEGNRWIAEEIYRALRPKLK